MHKEVTSASSDYERPMLSFIGKLENLTSGGSGSKRESSSSSSSSSKSKSSSGKKKKKKKSKYRP